MKVLQINVVYRRGSTGKIVACIKDGLIEKGIQAVVCYGRGDYISEEGVYKVSSEFEAKVHAVLSKASGVDFGHSYFSTLRLIKIIQKEKPDVVHLHCINGHFVNAYKLLQYLKKSNIQTVLTLHAEIMQTAGCEHALDCEKWRTECYDCHLIKGKISRFFRDDARHCYRLMKDAFDGFEKIDIIGVSEWLTSLAKESPVFQGANCRFNTIHNGIDTSVFHYCYDPKVFEKYNIPKGKNIVLYATPNFKSINKGGEYVLQLAEMMPKYVFVIVGYNDGNRKLPENVIVIAHTNNQKELASLYSIANCYICTSKCESLPTVCLEAAACGCPIVAFDVGGISETIPKDRGYTVNYGDVYDFQSKIEQVCNSDIASKRVEIANDYTKMVKDYIDIYTGTKTSES